MLDLSVVKLETDLEDIGADTKKSTYQVTLLSGADFMVHFSLR